jgi:hypothetical protein
MLCEAIPAPHTQTRRDAQAERKVTLNKAYHLLTCLNGPSDDLSELTSMNPKNLVKFFSLSAERRKLRFAPNV